MLEWFPIVVSCQCIVISEVQGSIFKDRYGRLNSISHVGMVVVRCDLVGEQNSNSVLALFEAGSAQAIFAASRKFRVGILSLKASS